MVEVHAPVLVLGILACDHPLGQVDDRIEDRDEEPLEQGRRPVVQVLDHLPGPAGPVPVVDGADQVAPVFDETAGVVKGLGHVACVVEHAPGVDHVKPAPGPAFLHDGRIQDRSDPGLGQALVLHGPTGRLQGLDVVLVYVQAQDLCAPLRCADQG